MMTKATKRWKDRQAGLAAAACARAEAWARAERGTRYGAVPEGGVVSLSACAGTKPRRGETIPRASGTGMRGKTV